MQNLGLKCDFFIILFVFFMQKYYLCTLKEDFGIRLHA